MQTDTKLSGRKGEKAALKNEHPIIHVYELNIYGCSLTITSALMIHLLKAAGRKLLTHRDAKCMRL